MFTRLNIPEICVDPLLLKYVKYAHGMPHSKFGQICRHHPRMLQAGLIEVYDSVSEDVSTVGRVHIPSGVHVILYSHPDSFFLNLAPSVFQVDAI